MNTPPTPDQVKEIVETSDELLELMSQKNLSSFVMMSALTHALATTMALSARPEASNDEACDCVVTALKTGFEELRAQFAPVIQFMSHGVGRN